MKKIASRISPKRVSVSPKRVSDPSPSPSPRKLSEPSQVPASVELTARLNHIVGEHNINDKLEYVNLEGNDYIFHIIPGKKTMRDVLVQSKELLMEVKKILFEALLEYHPTLESINLIFDKITDPTSSQKQYRLKIRLNLLDLNPTEILPGELYLNIFQNINNWSEIQALCTTDKKFHKLCNDNSFWKLLVLGKYPAKNNTYRREYNYKDLYKSIFVYEKYGNVLPELASFFVYENIIPSEEQADFRILESLIENRDTIAIEKIIKEKPDGIYELDWLYLLKIALNTEDIPTINEIIKYFVSTDTSLTPLELFSDYLENSDSSSDELITFIMIYPSVIDADRVQFIIDMTNDDRNIDKILEYVKKYNIKFEDINDMIGWLKRSSTEAEIILRHLIHEYKEFFSDEELVNMLLETIITIITNEDDIWQMDSIKNMLGLIYSLPISKEKYMSNI